MAVKPWFTTARLADSDPSIAPAFTGDGVTCADCGGLVHWSPEYVAHLHDRPPGCWRSAKLKDSARAYLARHRELRPV